MHVQDKKFNEYLGEIACHYQGHSNILTTEARSAHEEDHRGHRGAKRAKNQAAIAERNSCPMIAALAAAFFACEKDSFLSRAFRASVVKISECPCYEVLLSLCPS